jgi:hypothetical protein
MVGAEAERVLLSKLHAVVFCHDTGVRAMARIPNPVSREGADK